VRAALETWLAASPGAERERALAEYLLRDAAVGSPTTPPAARPPAETVASSSPRKRRSRGRGSAAAAAAAAGNPPCPPRPQFCDVDNAHGDEQGLGDILITASNAPLAAAAAAQQSSGAASGLEVRLLRECAATVASDLRVPGGSFTLGAEALALALWRTAPAGLPAARDRWLAAGARRTNECVDGIIIAHRAADVAHTAYALMQSYAAAVQATSRTRCHEPRPLTARQITAGLLSVRDAAAAAAGDGRAAAAAAATGDGGALAALLASPSAKAPRRPEISDALAFLAMCGVVDRHPAGGYLVPSWGTPTLPWREQQSLEPCAAPSAAADRRLLAAVQAAAVARGAEVEGANDEGHLFLQRAAACRDRRGPSQDGAAAAAPAPAPVLDVVEGLWVESSATCLLPMPDIAESPDECRVCRRGGSLVVCICNQSWCLSCVRTFNGFAYPGLTEATIPDMFCPECVLPPLGDGAVAAAPPPDISKSPDECRVCRRGGSLIVCMCNQSWCLSCVRTFTGFAYPGLTEATIPDTFCPECLLPPLPPGGKGGGGGAAPAGVLV